MLDFRAVLATTAVHGVGSWLLAAGIILPPMTYCMCGPVEWVDPPLVEMPRNAFLLDTPTPAMSETDDIVSFVPAKAGCGSGGPILIPSHADHGLAFRDGTRPLICVTVDAAGVVTAAWLKQPSGTPKEDRKALAAAWKLHFVSGKPGVTGIRPAA